MANEIVRGRIDAVDKVQFGAVLNDTLQEFTQSLGPYALAGLGHMLVVVPVAVGMALMAYVLSLVTVFGGMMFSVVGAVAVGEVAGEGAGVLSMLLFYGLTFVAMFAVIMVPILLVGALLAPLNASLMRNVAAHQRGESTLEFTSAFTDMKQDAVSVVLGALVYAGLAMLALALCYFPVFALPVVFGFATSLIALNRRGAIEAYRENLAHALADPGTHALYGIAHLGMAMVAGYVPVIGPMFLVALHVRMHRTMYGDP